MKPVIMFITSWCPHCKRANSIMEDLFKENPRYRELNIRIVDEELEPEFSKQYDYYYVPTFYVGDEKVHEGVPSVEIIQEVFNKALE